MSGAGGSAPLRDTIFVHGLATSTVIGVHAHERRQPQSVLVDVELCCDASLAARADDLRQAVDYAAVAQAVRSRVAALAPQLLETLAEALAASLMAEFRSPWVRIRLTKPGAVPDARAVGVLIERGRRPGAEPAP